MSPKPKTAKKTAAAKRKRAAIPADCRSLDAVYDILARGLGLPGHFGRNLDALYDSLARDVSGPFTIAVADPEALEKALGAKGKTLLKTLADVARVRPDATITLRPKAPARKPR